MKMKTVLRKKERKKKPNFHYLRKERAACTRKQNLWARPIVV